MLAFYENLEKKFPEYLTRLTGVVISMGEAAGDMYKVTAQTPNGAMVLFTKALIVATGATRKNLPSRARKS